MEWIAVDLDGTLAKYDGFQGIDHIGEPIPMMVDRVKRWLSEGRTVKIFTARAAPGPSTETEFERRQVVEQIQDWCEGYIGVRLDVTATKDFGMSELWDDRAVQVQENTGQMIGYSRRGLEPDLSNQPPESEVTPWYRVLQSEVNDHSAVLLLRMNEDECDLALHTFDQINTSVRFPASAQAGVIELFTRFENAEQAIDFFTEAAEESQRSQIQTPNPKILLPKSKH